MCDGSETSESRDLFIGWVAEFWQIDEKRFGDGGSDSGYRLKNMIGVALVGIFKEKPVDMVVQRGELSL